MYDIGRSIVKHQCVMRNVMHRRFSNVHVKKHEGTTPDLEDEGKRKCMDGISVLEKPSLVENIIAKPITRQAVGKFGDGNI